MTQTQTYRSDDAPLVTSKQSEAVSEQAKALGGAKGDALASWAVTINRPASELFAYWRNFTNLATFMDNIERIDIIDHDRSHWVVKAPAGKLVEWNAVITEEMANRLIAWTSEDGADVPNSGRVEFCEVGARGTVVTATIVYDPPAGSIGKLVAKVFQREPAIQARRDLRRFKQLMETGEVATSAWTQQQLSEEQA